MLLRTSSAPLAQSLFSDGPNRDLGTTITSKCNKKPPLPHEHCTKKISFPHTYEHLSSFCSTSRTVRRVNSESNLEGLSFPVPVNSPEEICSSKTFTMSRPLHNKHKTVLRTEPSFSIYSEDDKFEEEAANEEKVMETDDGKLERTATIGESIEAQFSFGRAVMGIIREDEEVDKDDEANKGVVLNRVKDLKAEVQGDTLSPPTNGDLDEYYNKMAREHPSNPLVLRNYAQHLESKRDLSGAEEYYARATLADPKDGEILSQYAKLVWELHGDQARASDYFNRATKLAPEDSNVLAAHASFLWDVDESDEEELLSDTQVDERSALVNISTDSIEEKRPSSPPPLHLAMGLGMDIAGLGGGNNEVDYMSINLDEVTRVEEYYRMMVEKDPCNPLFLRNYAHFLHQSKGDLEGAEEYYARTILQDPSDGQVLSLYAGILWELRCDKDRAGAYFERAVQAAPVDSNVLAAYAKFLWEAGDDEDVLDGAGARDRVHVALAAATAANA